jgi:hypothetical protein
MAELTIHLRVDPQTRKKDVIIIYHSDEDALPLEHEDEHKAIVDKLIEGGALSAAELGQIVVERDQSADEPRELSAAEEPSQREAIEQGS